MRQARIDDARGKAAVLAELEELNINEAEPAVIGRSIGRLLRSAGLQDDAKAAALVEVAQEAARTGERKQLIAELRRAARRYGIRRIGGSGRRVAFDPASHTPAGGERPPRAGTMVDVVRPGYDFLRETDSRGRPVRLDKTIVEESDG